MTVESTGLNNAVLTALFRPVDLTVLFRAVGTWQIVPVDDKIVPTAVNSPVNRHEQ